MNYRHIYHAGNFADVMKHTILVCLLQKLREKDKPFTVLDAFAGIGIYDLTSEEAQTTKEYENGVGRVEFLSDELSSSRRKPGPSSLLNTGSRVKPGMTAMSCNDAVHTYLSIISSLNHSGDLKLYPGSPYIIAGMLREHDYLIATELHPQDYAILKYNMSRENNVEIHHIDGYNAIKAFLPPKTPRGLVLLDAAFEVKNEYLKIIDALKLIRKRFLPGVVMIWYPIKDTKLVKQFYEDLKTTGYPEFLQVEFGIDDSELGMNKCGVIIANPPHIKDELELLMKELCEDIYHGSATSLVQVL